MKQASPNWIIRIDGYGHLGRFWKLYWIRLEWSGAKSTSGGLGAADIGLYDSGSSSE